MPALCLANACLQASVRVVAVLGSVRRGLGTRFRTRWVPPAGHRSKAMSVQRLIAASACALAASASTWAAALARAEQCAEALQSLLNPKTACRGQAVQRGCTGVAGTVHMQNRAQRACRGHRCRALITPETACRGRAVGANAQASSGTAHPPKPHAERVL